MLKNIIKQFETQPIFWKSWQIFINAKKYQKIIKNNKKC